MYLKRVRLKEMDGMLLRRRRSGGSRLQKLAYAGAISILAILISVVPLGVQNASAATCTDNDIMKCGYSSPSSFIDRVEANTNGVNNTPDLQAIYAHYGLSSAEYSSFAAHAVRGEAMRNGEIIVNGKVVASGARSIGREESPQGSSPFSAFIDGRTYYGNTNAQAFAPGVAELSVDVLFNSNGAFQFAVLPSCGNPEIPTTITPPPRPPTPPQPPAPTFACTQLTASPEDNSGTQFTFTVTSRATGGAKFKFADFAFGDGTTQPNVPVNSDGITATTTHTYTQTNNFTANAVVFFSVPNSTSTMQATAQQCSASLASSIPTPPAPPSPPSTPPAPPTPMPVPPAMPNTGAGNVIGLFSVVSILGYFSYRLLLLRRAKKDC